MSHKINYNINNKTLKGGMVHRGGAAIASRLAALTARGRGAGAVAPVTGGAGPVTGAPAAPAGTDPAAVAPAVGPAVAGGLSSFKRFQKDLSKSAINLSESTGLSRPTNPESEQRFKRIQELNNTYQTARKASDSNPRNEQLKREMIDSGNALMQSRNNYKSKFFKNSSAIIRDKPNTVFNAVKFNKGSINKFVTGIKQDFNSGANKVSQKFNSKIGTRITTAGTKLLNTAKQRLTTSTSTTRNKEKSKFAEAIQLVVTEIAENTTKLSEEIKKANEEIKDENDEKVVALKGIMAEFAGKTTKISETLKESCKKIKKDLETENMFFLMFQNELKISAEIITRAIYIQIIHGLINDINNDKNLNKFIEINKRGMLLPSITKCVNSYCDNLLSILSDVNSINQNDIDRICDNINTFLPYPNFDYGEQMNDMFNTNLNYIIPITLFRVIIKDIKELEKFNVYMNQNKYPTYFNNGHEYNENINNIYLNVKQCIAHHLTGTNETYSSAEPLIKSINLTLNDINGSKTFDESRQYIDNFNDLHNINFRLPQGIYNIDPYDEFIRTLYGEDVFKIFIYYLIKYINNT